jgi:zinc protease
MFKGTAKWPAGEFSKIVASYGGQENAFTSFDYTAYFQRVPKEHLRAMMDYEADRMTGLAFDESVVAPERDVVLEERRMRVDSDPAAQLGEEFSSALFAHHPYGTPIIGWEHEIEELNRDDAFAYYQRFYTPENAILVVAGDTDAGRGPRLAEETYGTIAGPRRGARPQAPGRARATCRAPRRALRSARAAAFAAARLADADLSQRRARGGLRARTRGRDSRRRHDLAALSQALRREELAAGASAYFMGSMVDRSAFQLSASPRPGVDDG